MNTTAIVIEHLIIGIETALWIVFFVLGLYGYSWIPVLTLPSQVFFIMLSVLVVYPLGVFMDEFSDWFFHKQSLRIRRLYVFDERLTAFQLLVTLKDSSTSQYFQYLRSRIRLARSSAVNFLFLTAAVIFFTVRQYSSTLGQTLAGVILIEAMIGAIVIFLALFSWWRVSHTFAKRISWGWDALQTSGGKDSKRRSKIQRK